MDLIDDIEKGFDLIKEFSFDISPFYDNNNWVSANVEWNDVDVVIKTYNNLSKLFKDGKRIMLIEEWAYKIDMSLINESTGDVIRIRSKKFDFDRYKPFLKKLNKEKIVDLRIVSAEINRTNGHLLDFLFVPAKNSP
jgi:hypothetical protein